MTRYQPDGWHTVTPRIFTHDVEGLIMFLTTVFNASGEFRAGSPAEIKIGDSAVMISTDDERRPVAAFLYVYVEDADATYQRALEAGAKSLEEPRQTPYGDRRAMIEDAWGNTWQIATHHTG
jgi:PhnB protein